MNFPRARKSKDCSRHNNAVTIKKVLIGQEQKKPTVNTIVSYNIYRELGLSLTVFGVPLSGVKPDT